MSTPTFEEVIKQIRFNMSYMGIIKGKPRILPKFYIYFAMIVTILIMEACFFVVNMAPENFLELTFLVPCMCIGILTVLKIVPIAMNRDTVFSLSEKLERLSAEILKHPLKADIVKEDIHFLNTLIKYYFVLNAVLICVYNFSAPFYILYHYITKKEVIFILPFPIIVPFSTETWPTWTLVYVFSISCGFISVLYYTTVDTLYFSLTSYVCIIFEDLSNKLKCLEQPTDGTLAQIIKEHQNALELAEDLETIFTLPNFFNVLLGSVQICALGFNLMVPNLGLIFQTPDKIIRRHRIIRNKVPGCLLFIISVLSQLFMMSVFGEKLIRASIKVGESAYLCDWLKMNLKTQKALLLLMIRSCKPARLTAFNFSVICYQGFTKIISTSWSYFTIIRTVYSTEDQ